MQGNSHYTRTPSCRSVAGSFGERGSNGGSIAPPFQRGRQGFNPCGFFELSVAQIVAKMDKALPGWKKYTEDRKKGVAKEKRRNLRDYQTFEHYYTVLRERGLKLTEARKQVAKS